MSEIISTDELYDFGAWARDHKDRLESVSAWSLVMQDNVGLTSKSWVYNMTDDKAAVIDKAVCALSRHNAHLGQVFVQHYVYGASYRELASHHKCSKSAVGQKLATASGFVIGRVSSDVDNHTDSNQENKSEKRANDVVDDINKIFKYK